MNRYHRDSDHIDVDVEVIATTDDAVLLDNSVVRKWVPRSQIIECDDELSEGKHVSVTVSSKTAIDRGFI